MGGPFLSPCFVTGFLHHPSNLFNRLWGCDHLFLFTGKLCRHGAPRLPEAGRGVADQPFKLSPQPGDGKAGRQGPAKARLAFVGCRL